MCLIRGESKPPDTRTVGCLRLCDKSWSVHPQRNTEKQWRGAQIIPCPDTPRPITVAISSSKACLHKPRGAQGDKGRQEQKSRTQAKGTPCPAPSRAIPGYLQPQCPGVKMDHQDDRCWSCLGV